MPLGRVDRDAPWLGVSQRFGELGVVEDAEAERPGAPRAAGPSVRRPQRERGGGRVGREHRGAIGGDDGGHGDRDLVGHLGHLSRRGKRARQLEQLDEVLALLAHLVQRGRGIEGGRRMACVDREHAALVGEEPVRLGIAGREASVPPARRHHVDDEQPRIVLGRRAAGEQTARAARPRHQSARRDGRAADRRRSGAPPARTAARAQRPRLGSVMRDRTVSTSSSDTRSAAVESTWSNVASRSASCAASTDALRRRPRCAGAFPSQLTS